jgi:hypothetical protein
MLRHGRFHQRLHDIRTDPFETTSPQENRTVVPLLTNDMAPKSWPKNVIRTFQIRSSFPHTTYCNIYLTGMVVATYWTNQFVKGHNSIHCKSNTRHIPYLEQKKHNVTEQILYISIHRNFSNKPSKKQRRSNRNVDLLTLK